MVTLEEVDTAAATEIGVTEGGDGRPLPGEPAALPRGFQDIHASYFDFVWASLRGLGVLLPAVDDAAQDVFIALHRRLPDFERRSTLKTFVYGIVVGVARNYRRAAKRGDRLSPFEDSPDVADTRSSPFESVAASEALTKLVSILDQMDDARREVLVLSEWEELSSPEIAEALGVGVNTVYSRLRLARAEFDRILSRDQGGRDDR